MMVLRSPATRAINNTGDFIGLIRQDQMTGFVERKSESVLLGKEAEVAPEGGIE